MRDRTQRSERGFAAMDEDRQRAIARKGGESVPASKRSFSQDHELAVEAGRKGGQSVSAEDRSFSRDRRLAAEAGRKGGLESRRSAASASTRPHSDDDEREGEERADEGRPMTSDDNDRRAETTPDKQRG